MLLRTVLDLVTGDLSDTRTRLEEWLKYSCKAVFGLKTNFSFHNVSLVVLPLSRIHVLRLRILRTGTRNSFSNINVREVFY